MRGRGLDQWGKAFLWGEERRWSRDIYHNNIVSFRDEMFEWGAGGAGEESDGSVSTLVLTFVGKRRYLRK